MLDKREIKGTSLEEVARQIYGEVDSESYERWIAYWKASQLRNEQLLSDFEALTLLDLKDRRVLDIGCGTGGLGKILRDRCGTYVGADYYRHVLRFAEPEGNRLYTQCNANALPFPDGSFDLILAFDVIEHMEGGWEWQQRFMDELRRVLAPLGMVFLTTPNFYYPYDAHTELYGPQFLPRFLRDHYIRAFNPEFLKEHKTFDNIQLLKPNGLRRLIDGAGLAPLHELPCGLDRKEYWRLHPVFGIAAVLGLGWYLHAEFWPILVHRGTRDRLRLKLRRDWHYVHSQPSEQTVEGFGPCLNFDEGPGGHQLGTGWHWHESDDRGFRWTSKSAVCYLESRKAIRYVELKGFSPIENCLEVWVDGTLVGVHQTRESEHFELSYLVPSLETTANRIFEVRIEMNRIVQSEDQGDSRELGVMIFQLGVTT